MERNIFVSFLGTNNYLETYYSFKGVQYPYPVRFIQEALTGYLCGHWSVNDKILIFCTKLARQNNWEDNGQGSTKTEGLQTRFRKMNLSVQVEMTLIEEGFSEEEIWSIFNTVYSKLEDGDQIYFDVTHAFRSIPMFSTVLFNYARYLKGTTLRAVYYGAFEKLGPAYMVREMPVEERIAPIVDLTSMAKLQELSAAANNFHQFGKMSTMSELLNIAEATGADRQNLDKMKKNMNDFDMAISTCKLDIIKEGKLVKDFNSFIKPLRKSKHLTQAHKVLIDKIQNEINIFKPHNTNDNVEAAIDWAIKYGMIQQAYTLAEELTISKVKNILTPLCPPSLKEKNKDFRKFVSVLLSLDVKKEEYKNNDENIKALFYQLLEHPVVSTLRPYYSKLANDRNIINHAKKTDNDLVGRFDDNYTQIREMLSHVHQPV